MPKLRGKFAVLDLQGKGFAQSHASLPEHKRPLTSDECRKVTTVVMVTGRSWLRPGRKFIKKGYQQFMPWEGEAWVVDLDKRAKTPVRRLEAEASVGDVYWNRAVQGYVDSLPWEPAASASPESKS